MALKREMTTGPRKPKGVLKRRDSKKSTSSKSLPRKGTKSQYGIIRYFQETGEELRKVAWPTRKQAIRLSLIVLAATLTFAIFLGSMDLLFQRVMGLLIKVTG